VALAAAFPGRLQGAEAIGELSRLLLVLVIVGGSLLSLRRTGLKDAARNALIWAAIILALVLAVSFKDEEKGLLARIGSTLAPSLPQSAAPGEMILTRDQDGAFTVEGAVDGARVSFLVDTGASEVVLAPDDARRAGIDMGALRFVERSETANGVGSAAPIRIARLEVGPVRLSNVRASVNGAPMRQSLLGMSFLKRLTSFRAEGDRLVLTWR
jgi:aspartyl protease family protein